VITGSCRSTTHARLRNFIKDFQSWAVWKHKATREMLAISLVALLLSISLHMFIGLHGSMEQQEESSSNCYMQVCLTYHHIFYVKPSMSQTPKLWFHVFQNISSVMNFQPKETIVQQFKFAQKLVYHDFPLRGRGVNLVFFLIATVFTCISLG
jgi:hypothetical protein